MSDSERLYLKELEEKFLKLRMNYYRFVIRSEDKNILGKFSKIPESWDNYTPADGTRLSDDVKSRLSDIRNKKSWELKLESLYLFYITDAENKILSVLQQRAVSDFEVDEAIDSLNNLILEFDDEFINFKFLMLALAKRSVSDFYYILNGYSRFFLKKNFVFETDSKTIMNDFIEVLNRHKKCGKFLARYTQCNSEISSLFPKSSNQLGWRMNEFAVKEYLDKSNQLVKIAELNLTVKEGFEYKKMLTNYFSFLRYYYNENDGKMFRLNFISETLKAKLDEGKISEDIYESYEEIRETFKVYKALFENSGILTFGPDGMSYMELLDFIYRASKIIEFYYLRNMKYEQLQTFRNDILFYVEKEIFSVRG